MRSTSPTRATRAARWSTRRPSGSPSRCASPIRGAAPRRLRVDGRTERLGSGGAVLGPLARLRRRARRRQRLAPPRRGPAVGRLVDRARPRLDERRQGQRPAHHRRAVAQARRRDRARHLARRLRRRLACSAAGVLDPVAVAPEVRLPRRALPVPAVDGALRAEGPAARRAAAGARSALRRGRHGHARRLRGLGGAATWRRRGCGWRPPPGCAPAPPTICPRARCSAAAIRPTSSSRTGSRPSQHARLVPQGDVDGVGGSRVDERHVPER